MLFISEESDLDVVVKKDCSVFKVNENRCLVSLQIKAYCILFFILSWLLSPNAECLLIRVSVSPLEATHCIAAVPWHL